MLNSATAKGYEFFDIFCWASIAPRFILDNENLIANG